MAILTEADRYEYFPLVRLVGPALDGALQLAQTTAEAAINRPLELTQFEERIEIPPSLMIPLQYHPIDFTKPITVTIERLFTEPSPLPAEDYTITPEGLLRLKRPVGGPIGGTIGNRFWRPMNGPFTDPINGILTINYWAGFDFSQDSYEIRTIKSSVAAILNYQTLTVSG